MIIILKCVSQRINVEKWENGSPLKYLVALSDLLAASSMVSNMSSHKRFLLKGSLIFTYFSERLFFNKL